MPSPNPRPPGTSGRAFKRWRRISLSVSRPGLAPLHTRQGQGSLERLTLARLGMRHCQVKPARAAVSLCAQAGLEGDEKRGPHGPPPTRSGAPPRGRRAERRHLRGHRPRDPRSAPDAGRRRRGRRSTATSSSSSSRTRSPPGVCYLPRAATRPSRCLATRRAFQSAMRDEYVGCGREPRGSRRLSALMSANHTEYGLADGDLRARAAARRLRLIARNG